MNDDDEQAKGRKLPPVAYRFLPGHSGHPQGRRKGSISRKKLTRKVALKRHGLPIDGRQQKRTLLELVILTARAMAMSGHSGASRIVDWVDEQVRPKTDEFQGGLLLLPERLNEKEAEAMITALDASRPYEPGSPEWHQWKRRPVVTPSPIDPASPLGIVLQEFKRKWGSDAPEPGVISLRDRIRQANDGA